MRQSLNASLLNHLLGHSHRVAEHRTRLYDVLQANDFAGLEVLLQSVYAGIPYEWHTNNDIAAYEGYYASVFYSYFTGSGFDVRVEDSSSRGRLDMAVPFNDAVYLFEFKVVELAATGTAMAQLRAKRYADKYRGLGGPIYLIAAEFSKVARNLHAFAVERA
ncbi:MAG: PD-(D/E)XK nuclease domain-containing protein [Spirochaetaceae bacterium]|nr:PD-(D/E)XK nuclease domain-containing protein [Spirochaetaceae bacterium]